MTETARAGSYRDRQLAAIARYTPADREAVLAFRKAAYSSASIFCDPAYLAWSVEQVGRQPPLWLYRSDGKIQGQQRVLPISLKLGDTSRAAGWNMDLFVSPAFQLRGIGSLLQQVAFAETGLSLGLEVSGDASKAYLRAGWRDLGAVPLYVRPLEGRTLVEARSDLSFGPVVRKLLGLGTVALEAADHVMHRALIFSGLRVQAQERFDVRVNALWRTVSPHYPVIARRDYATLAWRFDAFPRRDRYRLLYFLRGAELCGYVVLRDGRWNDLKAGFIVDFLCAPGDLLVVLAHAIAALRQRRPHAIYCLHNSPVSTRALRMLGFFPRDSGWHLMARAEPLEASAADLLFDRANWYLTLGDSDVDRPREGTHFPMAIDWSTGAEQASS